MPNSTGVFTVSLQAAGYCDLSSGGASAFRAEHNIDDAQWNELLGYSAYTRYFEFDLAVINHDGFMKSGTPGSVYAVDKGEVAGKWVEVFATLAPAPLSKSETRTVPRHRSSASC